MTVEYPFSLAQLAQILSALENERRNPNSKHNAIKANGSRASLVGRATRADQGRVGARTPRRRWSSRCCAGPRVPPSPRS